MFSHTATSDADVQSVMHIIAVHLERVPLRAWGDYANIRRVSELCPELQISQVNLRENADMLISRGHGSGIVLQGSFAPSLVEEHTRRLVLMSRVQRPIDAEATHAPFGSVAALNELHHKCRSKEIIGAIATAAQVGDVLMRETVHTSGAGAIVINQILVETPWNDLSQDELEHTHFVTDSIYISKALRRLGLDCCLMCAKEAGDILNVDKYKLCVIAIMPETDPQTFLRACLARIQGFVKKPIRLFQSINLSVV